MIGLFTQIFATCNGIVVFQYSANMAITTHCLLEKLIIARISTVLSYGIFVCLAKNYLTGEGRGVNSPESKAKMKILFTTPISSLKEEKIKYTFYQL